MASPRDSHGGGYIPGNISPNSSNATQASDGVSSLNPTSTRCITYLNQRHGGGYIPRRPVQSAQRNLSDPPRSIETPPNPRKGYYPAIQEPHIQQQPQTSSQTSYGASSPSASHYPVNHSQSSVQSPYNGDYVAHANHQSMPPPGQPVPNQKPGYNQGMPGFSSQTVSRPL
jgi:hypothetical protein